MTRLVAVLFVALLVLHQDWWWWDDPSLVLGFLPVGLAYHALYSVLAAALWWFALTYAWPSHIERFAEGGEDTEAAAGQGATATAAGAPTEGRP